MATRSPALPASVAAELDAAESAIVTGDLKPFAGPIKDQSGKERVAEGAELSDGDINSMTWLIEGVQGRVPT
jgi:simple sugar transport system substrate-binding protein